MGFNVEQAYEEIERTTRRTFKEDLKIILRFFGFKVKEN
jgi:hypothetical protein